MPNFYVKFTGQIDRKNRPNEGNYEDPLLRENWLARDGMLHRPRGTEKAITTTLTDIPRWEDRYYTVEAGQASPKSFVYTKDGKMWVLDDVAQTATEVENLMKANAYPKSWTFKTANQAKMFLVDGDDLWRYDGNNDNKWVKLGIIDASGNTIKPIDVIEHRDRLILITESNLHISKNLDPENFSDANDSLVIIVGSGKGKNRALGRIEDKLYIFTTEGIFVLAGDTISALANTFEVRLVDERKIIAGRTLALVEKALTFVADDLEVWSWDGFDARMLSFFYQLKNTINPIRNMLDKATAEYFNNYYMLSFVETGNGLEPNLELWWDALPDEKGRNIVDIVRGRNVSCYSKTDPSEEQSRLQTGRSDIGSIMDTERERSFDGVAIATRFLTRDITPKKGWNVRFTAFYPEMESTGDNNILFTYILDGRSSNPTGSDPTFLQYLRGEIKLLGLIPLRNQAQFSDRVRPKINYSRGESIAFYVNDSSLNVRLNMVGIGIDFVKKQRSKGRTIGA